MSEYSAEQFMIDCQRMCNTHPQCEDCPLLECDSCNLKSTEEPINVVRTTRAWARKHPPKKTNMEGFIKWTEENGILIKSKTHYPEYWEVWLHVPNEWAEREADCKIRPANEKVMEEIDQSCANCKHRKQVEKWDYTKLANGHQHYGIRYNWKEDMEGFVCDIFEDKVVLKVQDPCVGLCEAWEYDATGGE